MKVVRCGLYPFNVRQNKFPTSMRRMRQWKEIFVEQKILEISIEVRLMAKHCVGQTLPCQSKYWDYIQIVKHSFIFPHFGRSQMWLRVMWEKSLIRCYVSFPVGKQRNIFVTPTSIENFIRTVWWLNRNGRA